MADAFWVHFVASGGVQNESDTVFLDAIDSLVNVNYFNRSQASPPRKKR
jgi:hypothetical protein